MKDIPLIYDLWGSRLSQYYLKKCEMEVPSTVKFLKILSAKNDGWVFSSREILLLVKMIGDKINVFRQRNRMSLKMMILILVTTMFSTALSRTVENTRRQQRCSG